MTVNDFQTIIRAGIPKTLPDTQTFDADINHAPIRKDILSVEEKKLALRNALRYFEPEHHKILAPEFSDALKK